MTTFDEVMAEGWDQDQTVVAGGLIVMVPVVGADRGTVGLGFRISVEAQATPEAMAAAKAKLPTRAAIAVLGKRALAIVIAQEWQGGDVAGTPVCPECAADKYRRGEPDDVRRHEPGCEWGAIVAEAKKLRGGT